MTLAKFIVDNIDEILNEWVSFARTLSPDSGLEALRDHAERMLQTVAAEMNVGQSDEQQQAKSRGQSASDAESAAHAHGDQRYQEGFDLEQLVSEYRALRATVIRLWARRTTLDERTVYELTRFNEGIDQLLAESVVTYSRQVDHARELFMGVLGHDLRTDLQVIVACTERLERAPSKEQVQQYISHIRGSANSIGAMVENLLDVARTRFGGQLPIDISHMDAAPACEEALRPFRQLHSNCDIRLQIEGEITGEWDRHRLLQMLTNLVRNAVQHGDITRPITLTARGGKDGVVFKVHNYGPPIAASLIEHIFDPMRQGARHEDRSSLGLGLYIARTIAEGHRGVLAVTSSESEGTSFTATLPKKGRAEAG